MAYKNIEIEFSEEQSQQLKKMRNQFLWIAGFFVPFLIAMDFISDILSLQTILKILVVQFLFLASPALDIYAMSRSKVSVFERILLYLAESLWLPTMVAFLILTPEKNLNDILWLLAILFFVILLSNLTGWGNMARRLKKTKKMQTT